MNVIVVVRGVWVDVTTMFFQFLDFTDSAHLVIGHDNVAGCRMVVDGRGPR